MSDLILTLLKYLKDNLGQSRLASLAVTSAALIGLTFIIVNNLLHTPDALDTLENPIFQSITIFIIAAAFCMLISEGHRLSLFWKRLIFAVAFSSVIGFVLYITYDPTPTFEINLMVHSGSQLDDKTKMKLLSSFEGTHFHVTLIESDQCPTIEGSSVLFDQTLRVCTPNLKVGTDLYTILITRLELEDENYSNLFYRFEGPFAIISSKGVGDSNDDPLILKYLVVTIPLVAMQSWAYDHGLSILRDRTPDKEHGCLFDFSTHKGFFIEKIKSGPTLCKEEAIGIQKAFGKRLGKEYLYVLKNIQPQ